MGLLDSIGLTRLKDGLAKTRTTFIGKLNRLFFATAKIDDDFAHSVSTAFAAAKTGLHVNHPRNQLPGSIGVERHCSVVVHPKDGRLLCGQLSEP